MTTFTPAQLERQRDVALDMAVYLIEELEAALKKLGEVPTAADSQATMQTLVAALPLVAEGEPAAIVVLELLVDRLLLRGPQ